LLLNLAAMFSPVVERNPMQLITAEATRKTNFFIGSVGIKV
jgi:hypothetical protein